MIFKLVMMIGSCTFLIVCDLESRAVIDLMCVYTWSFVMFYR